MIITPHTTSNVEVSVLLILNPIQKDAKNKKTGSAPNNDPLCRVSIDKKPSPVIVSMTSIENNATAIPASSRESFLLLL